MNRQELKVWLGSRNKTIRDLQRSLWWDHAIYLREIDTETLYSEIVKGNGTIICWTVDYWLDQLNAMSEQEQEQALDQLEAMWS